jgi:hypothetical protein
MNAALRDAGIDILPAIEARTHSAIVAGELEVSLTAPETGTLETTSPVALDPNRLPDTATGRAKKLQQYCLWVTQAMLDRSDEDTADGPQTVTYRLAPAFEELISSTALSTVTADWNNTHAVSMTMAITGQEMRTER